MSSNLLTTSKVDQINKIVVEMSRFGSVRHVELERGASHIAAMRSTTYELSEGELRAVIYDEMFATPHARCVRSKSATNVAQ